MKFDLTTFLFQIVNFIVLLFILKRLLYKPVKEIIEKRRAMIENTVKDAEKTRQDALDLRGKYEEEMAKLKDLRNQTLEKLQEEALLERKRLLGKAEEEAGRVLEKGKAVLEAEKKKLQLEIKERSIDTACTMAVNLLGDLTDEELHKAVYRKLLDGLDGIAADLSAKAGKDESLRLELASAYPLSEEELQKFSRNLESLLSRKADVRTVIDDHLIAGARINAYDRVYNFSLSGQVDLFRRRLKETV